MYIDELQGKLPPDMEFVFHSTSLWHSTVTESELAALAGLLDPADPDSGKAIEQVLISIEQRPTHRILNPDVPLTVAPAVESGVTRLQRSKGRRAR